MVFPRQFGHAVHDARLHQIVLLCRDSQLGPAGSVSGRRLTHQILEHPSHPFEALGAFGHLVAAAKQVRVVIREVRFPFCILPHQHLERQIQTCALVALHERRTAAGIAEDHDGGRAQVHAHAGGGSVAAPGPLMNTCPTGITTHNPRLQKGLDPGVKSERVANYAWFARSA